LKKVLILSYFYPPSNFAGSERTASWAKYLNEFGYYPIIITRQWNSDQTDLTNKVKNNKLEIEHMETHEIHRLPFKTSLRDRCAKYPTLKLIQKSFTFIELIFSNFFISSLPYSNFFTYSKKLISSDSQIHFCLASGRPFQTFFIGHKLKKQFPKLRWLPDYRDEWTTHSLLDTGTALKKILLKLEKRSEKKWTSNADAFITVSEHLMDNISAFINKQGFSILNGFDFQGDLPAITKCQDVNDKLVFSYLGTVYPYQPMVELIATFIKIIDKNKSIKKIEIRFYGVEVMPSEKQKMLAASKGYEDNFIFFDRVPKESIPDIYETTDFLLLTNYTNIQSWLVVKLFNYSTSGRPILLYPSDKGVMEEFVKKNNVGFSFDSENEYINFIEQNIKKDDNFISLNINQTELSKYSRKNQAKALSLIFDKIQIENIKSN